MVTQFHGHYYEKTHMGCWCVTQGDHPLDPEGHSVYVGHAPNEYEAKRMALLNQEKLLTENLAEVKRLLDQAGFRKPSLP